jgi:putative transposase
MKKKVPVVRVVAPDVAALMPGMPAEATIAIASIAETMREGLLAFTTAAGLAVFRALLDEELASKIGPKHAKNPDRAGNWHGTTTGQVVLGGRKVSVERPRGRLVEGGGEIGLDTWDAFAADDLLQHVIVERMLAGVATRRHVQVGEPVGSQLRARSVSKSAVSRRFITATETAMAELLSRDLSGHDVAVLMIDGVHFADDVLVVAMIITTDGTKIPVGLAHGDTENSTVVKTVLADLVARGLRSDAGLLVVLDGSKALRKAVNSVFGAAAVVQRCTLHKRRNVTDYLPKTQRATMDRRLAAIFAENDSVIGLRKAHLLAKELELAYPDAAASLREGLDEMFTVARLGASATLRRSLTTTNAVESLISIARTTTSHVKNWRDGEMRKRWCATGMLEAERSFRRIKGHKELAAFTKKLRAHTNKKTDTVIPPNYTKHVA